MAVKKVNTQRKQQKNKRQNSSRSKPASSNTGLSPNFPQLTTPEDLDPNAYNVTAGTVEAEQIDLTDPNYTYDRLQADKLADRFMTAADYTLLDPADVQAQFGDISRGEMRKNAALSSDLALQAIDTELQGLLNYAPTAANLQRQQVALDNTTNQAEKLRMLEMADPNIRADMEAQRARAGAYAEGRVPDSILDRQLELGIQSRAADRAAAGGFGKASAAAAKAGQLMSAEQRIGLSQYGDQLLTSNIGLRRDTLVAQQQMATGGSQIQVMPSFSAGQASMAIASEANQGMITARDALSNLTQQEQFKTGLQQEANITNLQVSSERDFRQAQLNLQADTTNVENDIRTQMASKELRSAEARFNAELKTNTAIANNNLAFQAANANAGRALEVATSNRAVKLDVDKTNKTFVFNDLQRRQSEKFQSEQNRANNAAANARAAASAGAQLTSLKMQREWALEDRAFQLQLMREAQSTYESNRGDAQDSGTWGSIGNILAQAPSIIQGVSSVIGMF